MKSYSTPDTVLCKLRVSNTTHPTSSTTFRPAVTCGRKGQQQQQHHHHHHHQHPHHRTLVFNGISANSWLFPIGIRHSGDRKTSQQAGRPRAGSSGTKMANPRAGTPPEPPDSIIRSAARGEEEQSGSSVVDEVDEASVGCETSAIQNDGARSTRDVSQREPASPSSAPASVKTRPAADTTAATTTDTTTTTATTAVTTAGSSNDTGAVPTLTPEEFDSVWERVSHRPKSTGSVFIIRKRNLPTGISKHEYLQGRHLRSKFEGEEESADALEDSTGEDAAAAAATTNVPAATPRVSTRLKPRPFTAPGTRKAGHRSGNQDRLWSSRAPNRRPFSQQVAGGSVTWGAGGGVDPLLWTHHQHQPYGAVHTPALPFNADSDLVITPMRFSNANVPSEAWGSGEDDDGDQSCAEDTATRIRSVCPASSSSSSRSAKTKSATVRIDTAAQRNTNDHRRDVTDVDTIDGIKRSYLRRAKSAPPKVRSADYRSSSSCHNPTPRTSADPSPNPRGPSLYWRARSAYHKRLLVYGHDDGPDPSEQSYNPCGSMWRPLMAPGGVEDGAYDDGSMQHSAGCPYMCKGCFKACLVSEDFLEKARAEQLKREKEREESAHHRWGGVLGVGGGGGRLKLKHPPHKPRPVKVQDPQNIVSIALAKSQPLYKLVHGKQTIVVTVPKIDANAEKSTEDGNHAEGALAKDGRSTTSGVAHKDCSDGSRVSSISGGDESDSSYAVSKDGKTLESDVTSVSDESDTKSKTPHAEENNAKAIHFEDEQNCRRGFGPKNVVRSFTHEDRRDVSNGVSSRTIGNNTRDAATSSVTNDARQDGSDAKNVTATDRGNNSKSNAAVKYTRNDTRDVTMSSKHDAFNARSVTGTHGRIGNTRSPALPKVNGSDARKIATSGSKGRPAGDGPQQSDNATTLKAASRREKNPIPTTSKEVGNSVKSTQETSSNNARRDDRQASESNEDCARTCSSADGSHENYNGLSDEGDVNSVNVNQTDDVKYAGNVERQGDLTHGGFAGKRDGHQSTAVKGDAKRKSTAYKGDANRPDFAVTGGVDCTNTAPSGDISHTDVAHISDVSDTNTSHNSDVNHTNTALRGDKNHASTVHSSNGGHTNTAENGDVNHTYTSQSRDIIHTNTAHDADVICTNTAHTSEANQKDTTRNGGVNQANTTHQSDVKRPQKYNPNQKSTGQNCDVNQTSSSGTTDVTHGSAAHKIDETHGIPPGTTEIKRSTLTNNSDASKNCDPKDTTSTQNCAANHESVPRKSVTAIHEGTAQKRDETLQRTTPSEKDRRENDAQNGDVNHESTVNGSDVNSVRSPRKEGTKAAMKKTESNAAKAPAREDVTYFSNVRKGVGNASKSRTFDATHTPYDYESYARTTRIGDVSRVARTPYSHHHQTYARFNTRVSTDKTNALKPSPNSDKNRVSNQTRKADGRKLEQPLPPS